MTNNCPIYFWINCLFWESRAKPLQQNSVDNKGFFFIRAIGINGAEPKNKAKSEDWSMRS